MISSLYNGYGKSNRNCICTENELRLSPEQKTDSETVTKAVTFIVTGAVGFKGRGQRQIK